MKGFYETIKGSVTYEMIQSAARTLGENQPNVANAVNILIPTYLGALAKDGVRKDRAAEIMMDAGRNGVFSKRRQLFEGSGIIDGKNFGERFENVLIGNQNAALPNAVASETNISAASADRLSNWVAGLVAGYFGEKMINEKVSSDKIFNDLKGERGKIMADVPPRIAELLRLTACDIGDSKNHPSCGKERKTRNNLWLWIVIIAILLLLLCLFFVRSCRNETTPVIPVEPNVMERGMNTMSADTVRRQRESVTLSDGTAINVARGGSYRQMVDYLGSDRYRNASAADLRDMWFHFDEIDFVFDSADELTSGSMDQVDNLVKILKSYPDTRIMIAGYADNKGGRAVNQEISQQRANYIKSLFVEKGIASSRVSTEGFGKEFATVPADASDAARAIDRSIALRFVK